MMVGECLWSALVSLTAAVVKRIFVHRPHVLYPHLSSFAIVLQRMMLSMVRWSALEYQSVGLMILLTFYVSVLS